MNEASAAALSPSAPLIPAYLTRPAVFPVETAFSYCCLALSFSLTSPTHTRPSIFLWGTKTCRTTRPRSRQSHHNWAEVADEGGLGQLHLENDFPGGVCFVQSLEGDDGPRRHRAVRCHAVYLHHHHHQEEGQRDFTASHWQRHSSLPLPHCLSSKMKGNQTQTSTHARGGRNTDANWNESGFEKNVCLISPSKEDSVTARYYRSSVFTEASDVITQCAILHNVHFPYAWRVCASFLVTKRKNTLDLA